MSKKLTENSLRSMIRNIIREETEYQKFFDKALSKYGVKSPEELEGEKKKEIQDYLKSNFNLVDCPSLEQLLPFLKNDKKNEHDNINFSLLDDIGSCSYNNDLSIEKIKAIF